MQATNPFDQASQFGELTANIIKRTSDLTLETINEFLNISGKHLKGIGKGKGVEDIFEMTNDIGSTYINCSQKAFNLALENFSEISRWMEDNSQHLNPMKVAKAFSEKAEKKNC